MQCMALTRTGETTVGPIAVDGRTITLVARTRAIHVGDETRAVLYVRARPHHVEVLGEDGRRQIVAVRDIEYVAMAGITIGAIIVASALRAIRPRPHGS